jgi:hypothetical protein
MRIHIEQVKLKSLNFSLNLPTYMINVVIQHMFVPEFYLSNS